jgi:hypothetical protein
VFFKDLTCWKKKKKKKMKKEEYNNKWTVSGSEIAEIYCKAEIFKTCCCSVKDLRGSLRTRVRGQYL